MKKRHISFVLSVTFLFMSVAILGCTKKDEKECVDPPEAKDGKIKVTREHLGKMSTPPPDPNADWCQTCVMGPKGWASCQVVFAEKMGEDREVIKARSRKNACLDAGFEEEKCPEPAVRMVRCKGDPEPEGLEKPGDLLQKVYLKGKGGPVPVEVPAETPKAPEAEAAPPATEE